MNGSAKPPDAPAGHQRLRSNLLAGWLAHAVTLFVGFVMPRLILDSVGQTALGAWDLAWSFISFFAYTGVGAASAVSHFVARGQAETDPDRVRRVISSAFYNQALLALIMGLAIAATVGVLPTTFDVLPADLAALLPWIGLWSGVTVCATIVGDTAYGVLNGSHRNDLNDVLGMAHDLILALVMTIVLLSGFGIVALAVAAAGCRITAETIRLILAARVCPEFNCRWQLFNLPVARAMLRFGTKTLVAALQELLTYQVARLLLFASLGAPALAVFSRYFTLTRQVTRLVDRLTLVVPPMASELGSLGQHDRLKLFTMRAAGVTVMLGMPLCLLIAVFGDQLVRVWMGPEFVAPGLSWVLAGMVMVHLDRGVATRVLSGLNAHGRIALFCWGSSALVFAGLLGLLYPLDPLRTAILVAATMVFGVTLPHFYLACRRLRIDYLEYFRKVYYKPMIVNSLFLLGLLLSERLLEQGRILNALLVLLFSGAVLAGLYWRLAFDDRLRRLLRRGMVLEGV